MKLVLVLFVAGALLTQGLRGAQQAQGARPGQGSPGAQSPTFRAGIEVTALDVTVVDGEGRPLVNLQPADFMVRIDGKPRRVARVEWIPLTRPATRPAPPPPPDGYSTNENSTGGRLIVIAIDQPNIRPDGAMGLRSAMNTFIDGLEPADRVAAVAIGGGIATAFTTNRATVKDAIARMSGEMRLISEIGVHSLGPSEALDIVDGVQSALQTVVARECARLSVRGDPTCPAQIAADAEAIASSLRQGADRTLLSLQGLLDSLRKIDAPKTLVLVSEGFAMGSQSGTVLALGSLAAAARTSVYAMKLDDRAFDMAAKRPPKLGVGDRQLRYTGLEMLASASKGEVFDVAGVGDTAFQRLEREISGYYLIGVESAPADTDGKAHAINVQVGRRGAVVRARRELSAAVASARAGSPNPLEAIAAALSSPLDTIALPLHVATFSMRDQDVSKIQVLIHADVGSDYTSAKTVALGYVISDSTGTIVVHQVGDGRLAPPGRVPAPLEYTVSASLAPGEYLLKLAVTEGGRVGSIEHPIHAGLVDAGPLKLSELMIGGAADARELLLPSIGYDVSHDGVQGYMEAYGRADNLLMRYEVAPTVDAPSLLSAVVPGRSAGDGRAVFSYIMPVRELPPGQYYLRATLSSASTGSAASASAGGPLKKVARAFRVLPPAPGTPAAGATSAAPPASSSASASSAPSTAINTSARVFRREEATDGQTLQRFRETLAPAARKDFDEGVSSLTSGDFVKAEQSFKSAQRADAGTGTGSSAAPLTYLGATYAASGHDREAANVWQNALIDGSEYPEIYEWLVDTLIRLRNVDEARSILKEASEKWPAEPRFTQQLATLPPP